MNRRNNIKLSKRLEELVSFTEKTARLKSLVSVVDVGCDHALVPIALLLNGTIKKAIGMDVGTGPLEAAMDNVKKYSLSSRLELRQSDGLAALKKNEAQICIISGMGGLTIRKILTESSPKALNIEYLILSPQSSISSLRRQLRESGCEIDEEKLVYESGKYYPVLGVKVGGDFSLSYNAVADRLMKKNDITKEEVFEICDIYGAVSLNSNDETVCSYLIKKKEDYEKIEFKNEQVMKEIRYLNAAINLF